MRFRRKNNIKKTILVISDVHLGAGHVVDGKRNYLEDFHFDQELVEFLEYFSSGDYASREVELIINGDFYDLLAVPFVPFFDDEFWSEEAALAKLKMILKAHPEVQEALINFISKKNKKIIYIIGNHDGELTLPKLKEHLIEQIPENLREHYTIYDDPTGEYVPTEGVLLKHGHEYEIAHDFDRLNSIVTDDEGKRYFIPPWGSYYVTRVINKFKHERDYINALRPIKKAMINGLIYDTLFTIRFILATSFYFTMVRFLYFFKQGKPIIETIKSSLDELELFQNFEDLTRDVFEKRDDIRCLIVGHTHEPSIRTYADGNVFINTGTWTKMYHLDWAKSSHGIALTFAHIDVKEVNEGEDPLDLNLHVWKGNRKLPYREF